MRSAPLDEILMCALFTTRSPSFCHTIRLRSYFRIGHFILMDLQTCSSHRPLLAVANLMIALLHSQLAQEVNDRINLRARVNIRRAADAERKLAMASRRLVDSRC